MTEESEQLKATTIQKQWITIVAIISILCGGLYGFFDVFNNKEFYLTEEQAENNICLVYRHEIDSSLPESNDCEEYRYGDSSPINAAYRDRIIANAFLGLGASILPAIIISDFQKNKYLKRNHL